MPETSDGSRLPGVYATGFIEALVDRIAQGDATAMEDLYRSLMRGLRSNLGRQLPADLVEDRAHNVFLITVSAIREGQIRDPARLPAFIRTVAQRQAADAIRGITRKRTTETGFGDLAVPDHRRDPECELDYRQRLRCLREALAALSPRDREILTRFYLEEQTAELICREMNLSPTQFRLFKSRAKARLGHAGRQSISLAVTPRRRMAAAS
ncbi:MAG: sigma-70 family RNA polymerase sigma factor [Bryobacteraceae bacterium]|nr:sigma-70 family RNA polymerase sigma factor [Bryobacteraceae bacterium]